MGVPLTEWLELLKNEYLDSFIPGGGSAVRILVVPQERMEAVTSNIAKEASAKNFLVAKIDSGKRRVDKIENIFYETAAQIDWDALVDKWTRQTFTERGILVEDYTPLSDHQTIAERNFIDKGDLLRQIRRIIQNTIYKDKTLTREFRTAITTLSYGLIDPQDITPSHADLVKMWLKGEKCSLAELKKLGIFQKISRHNARPLLVDLGKWVRSAGYQGLVLILDFQAPLMKLRVEESPVRYSISNVKDCYEVLRQFIDDTDKMCNLLIIIIAPPTLLTEPNRGLDIYTALKQRTYEDVKARERENPLNMLVHLE